MIDWVCEILALEDNESLPRYLVVAMPKKRDIVNKLKMQ